MTGPPKRVSSARNTDRSPRSSSPTGTDRITPTVAGRANHYSVWRSKGEPCGCSATVTGAEIENFCEPLLWGTTEWAAEYSRRNMSEASFSLDQFHYGLDKNSIRVRAHKWDLAFSMLMLANFVRRFHSFVMRLGAHVLDPGYHSALDPEVFTLSIARVMKREPGSTSRRRGKPPSG